MSANIKAGIIGGAGYTGGELLRVLINHPNVHIAFAHSRSNAGKPISSVHEDLAGVTDLIFAGEFNDTVDVLFLCLGHGESEKFLKENNFKKELKIIDLANDFRLRVNGIRPQYNGNDFVYGLPELNRADIKNAHNIANPGCFATTIQLALIPLAQHGYIKDVYATGITGSTGAGQKLSATSHFSWRANNIQSYKTLTHQHLGELYQTLKQLQPAFDKEPNDDGGISFVPWRGDFTRGIFVSSQLTNDLSLSELEKIFSEYYASHPFTHVSTEPIFLKQVVNTNNCIIQLEKVGTKLVVHSALDNLLKGASGQAVQNMNLMFGLDETAGLKLKANYF